MKNSKLTHVEESSGLNLHMVYFSMFWHGISKSLHVFTALPI